MNLFLIFTSFSTHFMLSQRNREEIELQMAEESLKLKEISMQMKNFEIENSKTHESLHKRHKASIDELASQKHKFMTQLQQVSEFSQANCILCNFFQFNSFFSYESFDESVPSFSKLFL
jgi:hypothetical protein